MKVICAYIVITGAYSFNCTVVYTNEKLKYD
jgi:hypothetical protein